MGLLNHFQKALGRESRAQAVNVIDPAPKIIQSEQAALVASTSTSIAEILGVAVSAEAAAVLILNNTPASSLRIRQAGTPAVVTDGDIGNASLKLVGVKADFDDVALFSVGTPNVSIIVFGYRTQL